MEKMETDLFTSLAEGRNFVDINKKEGVICPCCGQIAKVYTRKLNKGMAKELIKLYKITANNPKKEWFHHSEFASITGGEISKLQYWGLVEPKLNEDTKKRTSGLWQITQKGIDFVESRKRVPSHAVIYNSKFLNYAGLPISIKTAYDMNFDYKELMEEKTND